MYSSTYYKVYSAYKYCHFTEKKITSNVIKSLKYCAVQYRICCTHQSTFQVWLELDKAQVKKQADGGGPWWRTLIVQQKRKEKWHLHSHNHTISYTFMCPLYQEEITEYKNNSRTKYDNILK